MNCILVLSNSRIQEYLPVDEGFVSIGRESDNDIQLLDETVSRHHCKISNLPSVCTIDDLDSANGTFINAQRITSSTLRHGDELKLGSCALRFEEVGSEPHDDVARARDYSPVSQHSTIRVKRHPLDSATEKVKPETRSFKAEPIRIKRKGEA